MLIWLIFAVLTALCLTAVLVPLARSGTARKERAEFDVEVYRDQLKQVDGEAEEGLLGPEEAEAARLEISRRLLASAPPDKKKKDKMATDGRLPASRLATIAVAVCVPAIALSVYLAVGSPQLPGQPLSARQQTSVEDQDLASLILKVEDHLRNHPEDGRGWKIIAPAYLQQRRFRDAASAYSRAMAVLGREPEMLTNYGEALVFSEQGLVTEAARVAFLEAAKADRSQFKAVFYLGLAERQDGKIQSAINLWQRLLDEGGKDAPWRPTVEAQLKQARASLSGAPELSKEQLAAADEMSDDERNEMVDGMVKRLADRLAADGSDLEGWLRLARSYSVLGRTDEAKDALQKAEANFAGNTDALTQISQTRTALDLTSGTEVAQATGPTKEDVDAAQSMTPEERREMIKGMVSRLAERLEEDGSDLTGWIRLARSYTVLGKPDAAREALSKAEKHFVGDPAALKQIEQARVMLKLGSSDTTEAPQVTKEDVDAAQSMDANDRRQMIEGMVSRLAERLKEEGGTLDEWLRLARSYAVLGRSEDARKALDEAALKYAGDKAALDKIEEARGSFGLNSE